MKKFAIGMAAVVAGIGWLTSQAGAQGVPAIKDIMAKLNKGPTSLCPTLGKQLKENAPNWDTIQKETKEFVGLAESLGKNEPPKGDKTNWATLTRDYAANARSLDTAAQKKDSPGAIAAHGKLAGACATCHKAHRN